MVPSLHLLSYEFSMSVKENPDRKKTKSACKVNFARRFQTCYSEGFPVGGRKVHVLFSAQIVLNFQHMLESRYLIIF